jgi:hypothetical protein
MQLKCAECCIMHRVVGASCMLAMLYLHMLAPAYVRTANAGPAYVGTLEADTCAQSVKKDCRILNCVICLRLSCRAAMTWPPAAAAATIAANVC